MQVISSKDNKIVKEAASLSEKKYRDRLRSFVLEGPNIVREAMTEGGRVRFIFIRAGALSEELADIVSKAENDGTAVYELTEDVFSKLASTDTPQGIIAVAEKRSCSPEEFFETVGDANVLVLDRLQDPGNVGTLIRTSEAMGFAGVISIKGTADVFGPKAVRAAAGSILRLPFTEVEDDDTLLRLLRENGKTAYATAMDAETAVYDAALDKDAAVIIGNEGNGVSKKLLSEAVALSIPMAGKTESLNAALAGAMIMYESLRQKLS